MALSLPYNLVFVPLDVLTAEELNNLMADINYIGNQFPITSSNIGSGAVGSTQLASSAVTSAKIGSSAVTSAKLASGSVTADAVSYSSVLQPAMATGSPSTSLTTSFANIGQVGLNFPSGAIVFAIASLNCTGSSTETAVSVRLSHGTTYSKVFSQTNAWGKHVTLCWAFTKTAGYTYLYLQAQKDNSSAVTTTAYELMCFRVG